MSGFVRLDVSDRTLKVSPFGSFAGQAYDDVLSICDSLAGVEGVNEVGRVSFDLPLGVLAGLRDELTRVGIEARVTDELRYFADFTAAQEAAVRLEAEGWVDNRRAELATHGETPFPFQERGINFTTTHLAAILADDMGLGKLMMGLLSILSGYGAIWVTMKSLIGDLVGSGDNKGAVKRWRPDLKPLWPRHLDRWPKPGEVMVVAYGNLPEKPPEGWPTKVILIADEAKMLKGVDSQRAKKYKALSRAVKAAGGRRLLLEGTPLMNRLEELYNLLDEIGVAEDLFGTRKQFACIAAKNRPVLINGLKAVILRREKDEVWPDLPRTTRVDRPVSLTEADRTALDAALDEIRLVAAEKAVKKAGKEAQEDGRSFTPDDAERVRRKAYANVNAAIDLAFSEGGGSIPFELTSRVKSILALAKSRASAEFCRDMAPSLDEQGFTIGRPLLFFSEHIAPVELIGESVRHAATITGQTPAAERTRIVTDFQAKKIPVLAMTGATGGVGFTLTSAATGISNDLPWNWALVTQIEDRMRRPGQDCDRVQMIRMVADHPLDRRILELITEKQVLFEGTVGKTTVPGLTPSPEQDGLGRLLERGLLAAGKAESQGVIRGPATPEERALVAAARVAKPTPRLKSLRQVLRRGLNDLGWGQALRRLGSQRPTGPRGPCNEREDADRLLILSLARTKSYLACDARAVTNLAKGLKTKRLADGEWGYAAALLAKYRVAEETTTDGV